MSSAENRTVTVPVNLDCGSGITVLQFALLYDADRVSVTNAVAGEMMSDKDPTINANIPGVVYFNWDSTLVMTDRNWNNP